MFDTFWFEKNLQGDIIAVYNDAGTLLATYAYDAWGGILSTKYSNSGSGTGAVYNPFRYRGYYRDSETGFYYLNSRYYDPGTGRFINADGYLFDDLLGNNLYAYCNNSPVMLYDPTGHFGAEVINFDWDDPLDLWPEGLEGGQTSSSCSMMGQDLYYSYGIDLSFAARSSLFHGGIYNCGYTFYTYYSTTASTVAQNAVCFVAGTLVETEDGNIPIEEVAVGDMVYAHNPETGETELKQVVNAFVNESDELVHIEVNGEHITTTPRHPFWVPQKGWTAAIDLRAGDRLQLLNGEYVVIEQIQHELLESPVTVYNFEVEGFHTYYVTDSAILVHNTCYGWKTIVEEPKAYNQIKNFDNGRMKIYENTLTKLASGDRTGLHIHPLKGDYAGKLAADLKGIGSGRGQGRIIFTENNGTISIFEVNIKHYK